MIDIEKAKVFITCPEKNKPVWTGVLVVASEWDSYGRGMNRQTCDLCGQVHEWTKDDACYKS